MRDLKSCFGEQVTTYIIGDGVTSIGNSAFDGCTNLTNITISESVSSIEVYAFKDCTNLPVEDNVRYADSWAVGVTDNTLVKYNLREDTRGIAGAFYGCTSLARITLPENLEYISDYAFYYCSALKSLVLPEKVSSIGYGAFLGCTNLADINIPSGVVSIGQYAFYNCALPEVLIPKGIIEIEDYAFYGNNFSTIEIPEKVVRIGYSAFQECSLESVTLPQDLMSIGNNAFKSCRLSSITIPENVTSIGSSAFTNLKSVTLNSPTILSEGGFTDKFGNYVTEYVINADAEEIKDYAFYNSTALQSITLPETLISIGEGAFENCTQLDSVRIPLNVATIKDYAFSCCTGLKYLACNAPVPPTCGTDAFAEVNTAECTLEVPDTVASIYATTVPWSSFNIKAVETPKEEIITRVDLVDGEVFENAEEAIMETITYTRTLNNQLWNALYVPFEIPVSQLIENYDIAYINAMHSYDTDDNGAIDKMEMEVVKIKEGTLHANYPYLIRAKNEEAKAMKIVVENSTLYAAENVTVDCSSVFTKFENTGTYQPLTNEEIAGCYALSGGTWKTMPEDATLNPFRLYLRISDREGSPVKVDTYALEQTSVTIRVQGENPGTTSIESKEIGVKNEESDATIYNLMGQPVKNPVKGSIYIQGGRKVVW